MTRAYRASGVTLPQTSMVSEIADRRVLGRALVVAPPGAQGSAWMRRFAGASTGFASGWMRIRGARRRRAFDRGFVVSDHVDWPALVRTVAETGAERVWVTHGYAPVLARWLRERGLDARAVQSRFVGESVADEGEPAYEPASE
jgi:putative mRNA 3-end processing factor